MASEERPARGVGVSHREEHPGIGNRLCTTVSPAGARQVPEQARCGQEVAGEGDKTSGETRPLAQEGLAGLGKEFGFCPLDDGKLLGTSRQGDEKTQFAILKVCLQIKSHMNGGVAER